MLGNSASDPLRAESRGDPLEVDAELAHGEVMLRAPMPGSTAACPTAIARQVQNTLPINAVGTSLCHALQQSTARSAWEIKVSPCRGVSIEPIGFIAMEANRTSKPP